MADPRGFMNRPRVDQLYRPRDERLCDFHEVSPPLDEGVIREQAARCMDCGVPFCQGDTGCPLGNLIPEWNDLANQDRWDEALDRLHLTNNFPEFTGRLCPAPCESACVLGLYSEAVTIKSIEQQIADHAIADGKITPRPSKYKTGKRAAIIGSGPAGLAAAQELARLGHEVTVFEKAARIGGLLRYGIPDFKMEKHHIDRRIVQMEAEGVVFKTSTCVGTDVNLADLQSEFDVVGLAMGAEQPRDLLVPGRELVGIHFAMDYLLAQNRSVSGEQPGPPAIDAKDKTVIIIGGGDTGSDCLGTALRQGAREVYQFALAPQPPKMRSPTTPWPYWPLMLRSSHAHLEGGIREWCLSTREFVGHKGHVTHLIADRLDWSQERPQPLPDCLMRFDADLVILAIGFAGPENSPLLKQLSPNRDDRGNIITDKQFKTSADGVFAAGDVRRGPSLIVWAIAEGRRMARGMDRWLVTSAQPKASTQDTITAR